MALMQTMTEQQRMLFMTQMGSIRKDGTVGVLLALFLGGLGAHRFYMNQVGLGIVYVLFCWTFIPAFIALIECFLMSGRVQRYNTEQADLLAIQIRGAFPNR
jgi:TM2 domain-containing membrane protein YozV